jgi:hypothetical protein
MQALVRVQAHMLAAATTNAAAAATTTTTRMQRRKRRKIRLFPERYEQQIIYHRAA